MAKTSLIALLMLMAFETFMAEQRVPGMAVVLIEEGQITLMEGYGVRNPEGDPVTPQTQFILGPGVTLLTEELARQLISTGALDADALLNVYLPCLDGRLTVSDALTAFPSGDVRLMTSKNQRPEALQESVCMGSTPIPVMLAAAAASANGTSYEAALTAFVFEPNDMTGSFARPERRVAYSPRGEPPPDIPQMATGYRYWFSVPRPEPELLVPRVMAPAGVVISTAEDMGRLLPTLTEPVWQVGYAPHFSSVVVWQPEEARGLVILANAGVRPQAMSQLAADILDTQAMTIATTSRPPGLWPLAALIWSAASGVWAWRRKPVEMLHVAAPLLIDLVLVALLVRAAGTLPLELAMLYYPAQATVWVAVIIALLACGFARSALMLTGGGTTRPINQRMNLL